MADIFISYARADRDRVEKLAAALEAEGYSVWWDRQIVGGAEFSKEIERELKGAKAVIVAWSASANDSAWVKDEASAARDQGKLIPVRLDDEAAPIGFRQYQAVHFEGWKGEQEAPAFKDLSRAVEARLKRDPVRAKLAASSGAPDRTIAVLPFVNMSSDPEQEYFSDGIAEEILGALSRLDDLRVAGRTSSFSFKGKTKDLRTIGETLNVAHILEGSVRKQGNRVRISAQLVKAQDGFQLWSETFDRTLDDIFAIQDEIARSITAALKVVLTNAGEPLIANLTDDKEAYDLYLQARSLIARRIGDNLPNAIVLLEDAVSRDPKFARAWSSLAAANILLPAHVGGDTQMSIANTERFALKALELDEQLGEPHALLGLIYLYKCDYARMHTAIEKALLLEPNDLIANFYAGFVWAAVGYLRAALERLEKVTKLDPAYAPGLVWRAVSLISQGEYKTAERAARRAVALGSPIGNLPLARALYLQGKRGPALTSMLIEGMVQGFVSPFSDTENQIVAEAIYGEGGDKEGALGIINRSLKESERFMTAPCLLMYLGYPDEAFGAMTLKNSVGWDTLLAMSLWEPRSRDARQHPSFQKYAKTIGLVDYWKKYGWPDLCRPIEGGAPDAFECD